MTSDHVKSDVDSYLSGTLPESRRREIETHLAGCGKCRQAVSKARYRQARGKREALKRAYPDRVPNLMMARLGKQAGLDRRPRGAPWRWLGVFLAVAAAALLVERWKSSRLPPLPSSNPNSAESSVFEADKTSAPVVSPEGPADEAVPVSSGPDATAPEPVAERPQQWAGADSGVTDYREVVIKGRAAWRALWDEMKQPGPAPWINFNQWIVVGIFAGEKAPGTELTLLPPNEEDGQESVAYQLTSSSAPAGPFIHPYRLMTIPRSAKKVRFAPAF